MSFSVNSSPKNLETENLSYNTCASTSEGHSKLNSTSLSLPATFQKPHLVTTISECAKDSLDFSTVVFETQVAGHSHPDFVGTVANCDDVFSPSIQDSDEDELFSLIDNLFQNQLIYPTDLSNVPSQEKASVSLPPESTGSEKQIDETFSPSLKKPTQFKVLPARRSDLSSSRVDTLSFDQKQIIELSVANSVEILKTKIKDVETLKNLLGSAETIFNGLPHYDILSITGWLQYGTRDYLGFSASPTHSLESEKEFYSNAVHLALVYYSRANLEEALLKWGEGLPSEEKIQETILNFFENYKVD